MLAPSQKTKLEKIYDYLKEQEQEEIIRKHWIITSKLTRCVSDDRREKFVIQIHHLIPQPKQAMEIKKKRRKEKKM